MTVPQQRSQQQPWPSTVTQQRTLPPHERQRAVSPAPAAHRADTGRGPIAQTAPSVDGSVTMTILRTTAYVLTSIASLLFILLVIYGAVKVNQLQDAFSSSPFGSSYSSSSY